jgi:hypothetical protein
VGIGSWPSRSERLLGVDRASLRCTRNYAILAMLIGCGLRRGELLCLQDDGPAGAVDCRPVRLRRDFLA